MDYNDLSKEELVKKLKEKSHLADAINAKDSEITKLKKELKSKIEELSLKESELSVKEKEQKPLTDSLDNANKELIELRKILELTKQKHAEDISNVKKGYEERIINLDLELNSLKEVVNKTPDVEKLYKAVETLTKENKLLVKTGNAHLAAFRNLMKSIQGTMDNAIELESIITENLQNNLGGIK